MSSAMINKRVLHLTSALSLLAAVGVASAEPATVPASAETKADDGRKALHVGIARHRLDNGLRVVLNEDHSAPTVAVCVTYDVGSRNEQQGRSGFAHLFEHMMFQGSRNVAKGQHFELITERGGTLNGTTSVDRTNYFELMPANALATVLWLEADRMQSLAITKENFENQRQVVQEEYRMRVSNAAYAESLMRLRELVFQGYWAQAHDPIGSMQDLDAAKLSWLREFHDTYYAPNNAVLTIAGDFEPKQALELVNQYFGDIKPSTLPVYAPGQVPEQTQPRAVELTDSNAKTPGLMYGWVIPATRAPEHYALELATVVLTFGDSSVLEDKLVRNESLLRSVASWTYDHRGPDMLALRALLTERADMKTVEQRIDEEIAVLAKNGPTEEQLSKAKQRIQSYLLFGMEGNLTRATQLSNYELFWGDAGLLNTELGNYFEVTSADVQRAVAKYLTRARRSTVYVYPEAAQPTAAAPAASNAAAPANAGTNPAPRKN